jgi:hypothetical protein
MGKRRYHFGAEVTISIHAEVEASSESEARELLSDYPMGTIHENDWDDGVWKTSGELDGEPCNIRLDEVTDD